MVPSTNISTTVVGNELGTSARDVGLLCTSPNINMWAKYKPVRYKEPVPDRASTIKRWWKGDDGLCGLRIPTASGSPDSIYDQPWGYNPPTGTSTSAYRLADFGGYNHNCVFPLTGWMSTSPVDIIAPNHTLDIHCAILSPTPLNNLQVTDVDLISNFRLAVKITAGSDTSKAWILTSALKVSEVLNDSSMLQITIDFKELAYLGVSKFTITLFFTTDSYPTLSTFPTVITCYSVPNYWGSDYGNRKVVNYTDREPGLNITCEGLAQDINATFRDSEYCMNNPLQSNPYSYEYWKLSITNNNSAAYTLYVTDITWYALDFQDKDITDDYNRELKLYNSSKSSITSLTIPAYLTAVGYVRTRLFSLLYDGTGATKAGVTYGMIADGQSGGSSKIVGRFELKVRK